MIYELGSSQNRKSSESYDLACWTQSKVKKLLNWLQW
jgi:hypothetical protein